MDQFGKTLSNLPNESGGFKCYFGFQDAFLSESSNYKASFLGLKEMGELAFKENKLQLATNALEAELSDCETLPPVSDKQDKSVSAEIFFAGMNPNGKIKALKESLRGVYVRVHGRLLKHNFSEHKYVYGISKYNSLFSHGLRVELNVDWLRNQITLSRDGIKFSNPKLEDDFKGVLTRIISGFIRPKLDKIQKSKAKANDKNFKQRMELANKRVSGNPNEVINASANGFTFRPETDAELAILLAQKEVMNKINKNYKLIDYNDKAPFDCIIYDQLRMSFINSELEPTLMEFLDHRVKDDIELIIVWTTNKWRMGSRKKGRGGFFELLQDDNNKKAGHYKLLEYPKETSQKPRLSYRLIVVEEILK